jgi:hypothetical protein
VSGRDAEAEPSGSGRRGQREGDTDGEQEEAPHADPTRSTGVVPGTNPRPGETRAR